MPRYQRITTRARQRIRARVAETRRVPLSEVQYPRANTLHYYYLYEVGEIRQQQYHHLIYRHYYPLTQEILDFTRSSFLRRINANNERLTYHVYIDYSTNGAPFSNFDFISSIPLQHEGNQIHMEHPMEGIGIMMNLLNEGTNRNIHVTHERIMERYGERLSESNNSLCRECLMPIVFGEELCEECQQEEQIIPQWMF